MKNMKRDVVVPPPSRKGHLTTLRIGVKETTGKVSLLRESWTLTALGLQKLHRSRQSEKIVV